MCGVSPRLKAVTLKGQQLFRCRWTCCYDLVEGVVNGSRVLVCSLMLTRHKNLTSKFLWCKRRVHGYDKCYLTKTSCCPFMGSANNPQNDRQCLKCLRLLQRRVVFQYVIQWCVSGNGDIFWVPLHKNKIKKPATRTFKWLLLLDYYFITERKKRPYNMRERARKYERKLLSTWYQE